MTLVSFSIMIVTNRSQLNRTLLHGYITLGDELVIYGDSDHIGKAIIIIITTVSKAMINYLQFRLIIAAAALFSGKITRTCSHNNRLVNNAAFLTSCPTLRVV